MANEWPGIQGKCIISCHQQEVCLIIQKKKIITNTIHTIYDFIFAQNLSFKNVLIENVDFYRYT